MNNVYKALLWITEKLGSFSLNYVIRKIHDKTIIPLINKKTIAYMNKGNSENVAILESLYDLGLISNSEIQILRNSSIYYDDKCKNGKRHSFYEGKCEYCEIIGCSVGLRNHNFYEGKCEYCGIIGCSVGLRNHNFYEGKCEYCGIIGCEFGLRNHNFYEGKCEYCGIIGCKFGLRNHNFYEGKCEYCGIKK